MGEISNKTQLLFHSRELDFLEGRKPIPSSYRFFPFEQLPSRLNLAPVLLSTFFGVLLLRTVFLPQNHIGLTIIGFTSGMVCWMIAYLFLRKILRRNYLLKHPNDPFFRKGFYAHESHWILWTQYQLKGTWDQIEVESIPPRPDYGYWRYFLNIFGNELPTWIPCKQEVYLYVKTKFKEPERYPNNPL